MVTVTTGPSGKWKIAIYGREHGVPHFHLIGPDFDCVVTIGTLEVLIGRAPRSALRDALAWARTADNRAAMLAIWREQNR